MAPESILAQIVGARRRQVNEARLRLSLEDVRAGAAKRAERRDFAAAIASPGFAVIAEVKKASPSRGLIRADFNPGQIARAYESAGAAAISVLTEEQHFQGSLHDLRGVRESVRLPVLRKDFIVDEYQVYESVAAGADALLLIVAALDNRNLKLLMDLSRAQRISSLVEIHTKDELDRAVTVGAEIIGVNNRDLKTLNVDLEASFRLREKIPPGRLAVSESGIKTPEHLQLLREAGFHAALIGEHLLQSDDPGRELARLLGSTSRAKVY